MAPRLVLDPRTLRLIAVAFVLLAALTIHRLFLAEIPLDTSLIVIEGETMGTTYEVRIAGDGLTEELRERVRAETDGRLAQVDGWMSNWNPKSEISRFNAHRGSDGFPVSFETAEVVTYAVEITKLTGAAFDITVGPLVARWGFGNRAQIADPPSQDEINKLLSHMGARGLRTGRGNTKNGGFLRKASPETQIDLSAIAKGYGVDHVAAGIFVLGREDFLVEIGGEVRASGARPGGGAWRVAIEKPNDEGRAIQSVIELRDQSMATSGDYRIFYRHEGRRISHTIDPRTGRPVEDGPASSTAIHESATVADTWATALMVLGEDGLELAASQGVAARLMWRGDEGAVTIRENALFPEDAGPSATAD